MPEFSDLFIVLPAFLAGVLVLLTHVPLGEQVLARGIVFIDLAIAQIAGLGVIAAGLMGYEAYGWQVQVAAALAAILGAFLLTWTEKWWPDIQEAQIGVIFVLAATGGLLLLAHNPHGGEHLKDLLSGQILWVNYQQLVMPLIFTGFITLAISLFKQRISGLSFYLLFALSVTISVQLVGVYLVFASLIIPSLSVRKFPKKKQLLAYVVGIIGYFLGLAFSLIYDLPAGAVIVWCLLLIGVLAYFLSPRLAITD